MFCNEKRRRKRVGKKAIDMHEKATASIKKEQIDAIEEYIDTLFEIQSFLPKGHLLRGANFLLVFS